MPLPKPKNGEEKQSFLSRCIATMTKEESDKFPDRKQRAAICYSQWGEDEKRDKKKNAKKGSQK